MSGRGRQLRQGELFFPQTPPKLLTDKRRKVRWPRKIGQLAKVYSTV